MLKYIFVLFVVLTIPFGSYAQSVVGTDDADGDGLLNEEEDRNANGIVDDGETNPFDADTDGGGEADGSEVHNERNPLDPKDDLTNDLDGDGLTNGQEDNLGTNRENVDSDNDTLNDDKDPFPLDARYTKDMDGDGLPDEFEDANNMKKDVRSDSYEDPDNDGLSNIQEFIEGTDMNDPDTDKDGTPDGEEVAKGNDPLENPCLYYAGPTEVLHDIDTHWSKPFVTALQQTKIGEDGQRIVQGYWTEDGALFQPDKQISRYELLKIALLSSCHIPNASVDEGEFTFPDVRRVSRPRETEDDALKRRIIYSAYERGVIAGYPDGTFRPDAPINRAEALKILFLATNLSAFDNESYENIFSDVSQDDWFTPYIHDALSYAFIEGYDDGTFRPGKPITRGEATKLTLFMTISNPYVNGYVIPVDDIDI